MCARGVDEELQLEMFGVNKREEFIVCLLAPTCSHVHSLSVVHPLAALSIIRSWQRVIPIPLHARSGTPPQHPTRKGNRVQLPASLNVQTSNCKPPSSGRPSTRRRAGGSLSSVTSVTRAVDLPKARKEACGSRRRSRWRRYPAARSRRGKEIALTTRPSDLWAARRPPNGRPTCLPVPGCVPACAVTRHRARLDADAAHVVTARDRSQYLYQRRSFD